MTSIIFIFLLAGGSQDQTLNQNQQKVQHQDPVFTQKDANVIPPKFVHRENPTSYPVFPEGRTYASYIMFEFIIGSDGEVEKGIKVLRPLYPDIPEIVQPFIDAIEKYRFEPATLNGKPVRFKMVLLMDLLWQ